MKVEGTVTLEIRISTIVNQSHTLEDVKNRLIVAANEGVRNNQIKATVTNILIRDLETESEGK